MYICKWSYALGQVVGDVCMYVCMYVCIYIYIYIYTAQAQHASRIHVSVGDACMSVSVMPRADT